MSETDVLFLPTEADGPYHWLRLDDGQVTARGDGLPDADGGDRKIVAIAPADAVTLHWAELPARSPAQAVAAARIMVADASAAPIDELHVAVGREGDAPDRPVAVVAATRMRSWLAMLAEQGVDPDRIIPAPMLLPRPEEGYVRADLAGGAVVRGTSSGFADEAMLTQLVTGDTPPVTLAGEEMDGAIASAVATPPLDLRQGAFARRRRAGIDWALVQRLAWLGVAILTVTLAISLVQIAKYSFGADALEVRADALAQQGLPRGEVVNDADRQLNERLAALRGPGQGFSGTAAAVLGAVQSVPGTEVTGLAFQENGDLRVSVAAQGEAQTNDLKARLEATGFKVQSGVFQTVGGRVTGDLTVTAP